MDDKIGKGAFAWVFAAKLLSEAERARMWPASTPDTTSNEEVEGELTRMRAIAEGKAANWPPEKWQFALKKVLPEHTALAKRERDTLQTIKDLATLSDGHYPLIVFYQGSFEHGGQIFLSFERMENDLCHLLGNKFFSNDLANQLVCLVQLACAVLFLHQRNLIHRDIKPANVLFRKAGERIIYKVADFGLATEAELFQASMTRTAVGWGRNGYCVYCRSSNGFILC